MIPVVVILGGLILNYIKVSDTPLVPPGQVTHVVLGLAALRCGLQPDLNPLSAGDAARLFAK